jgi:hypothetical protein
LPVGSKADLIPVYFCGIELDVHLDRISLLWQNFNAKEYLFFFLLVLTSLLQYFFTQENFVALLCSLFGFLQTIFLPFWVIA